MVEVDRWEDSEISPAFGMAGSPSLRPQLGLADLLVGLWRAKGVMLLAFAPIAAFSLLIALQMPTKYEAASRLFVSLGDEYVFRPRVGEDVPTNVGIPEQQQLIQAELEILRSPVVAERVLPAFGLERLYPKLIEDLAAHPARETPGLDRADMLRRLGVKALQEDFNVWAAPESPTINLVFKHTDRILAEEVLNALIGQYLRYRSDIFTDQRSDAFSDQRRSFESQLLTAEDDIRAFLANNNIGDFAAERAAAQALFGTVNAELFQNRSRESAVLGQIEIYRQQLGSVNPLVDIFVEDSREQALSDLQLQREQLLSRYTPQSRPVQNIEREIAQVRSFLSEARGAVGTVRRGPNPLYQEIETNLSALQSEAEALREQRAELLRQQNDIESRQRRISDLEPRWQELQRRRDLLESNVRSFAEREVEALTLTEISQKDADNIRILETARAPLEGSSLKLYVAAGGWLFAGFIALGVGLLHLLTRRGFMTETALARTTGLPVLAVIAKT